MRNFVQCIIRVWNCLKKNSTRCFAQWYGTAEDNDSDDQRNAWVKVIAGGEGGKPYDQRRCNDTDIAQGITHNMQEDTSHIEIAVRVSMTTMAMAIVGVFGLIVVVFVVIVVGAGSLLPNTTPPDVQPG